MKNKEILLKAVMKAIENGYRNDVDWYNDVPEDRAELLINANGSRNIIFDHDFAKAFWPEEIACTCHPEFQLDAAYHQIGCAKEKFKDWKIMLQNMVLEEDPIAYLEQFIDSDTKKR